MSDSQNNNVKVYFAAVGDVHGHFNKMEAALSAWEKKNHRKLDFVLQVGDLEPIRDETDLASVATPAKYRRLGDFPGIWKAGRGFSRPLVFIGGNHEPYGFLEWSPEGSMLMPNLIYLGRAGAAAMVGGLRVVGLTGVYSEAGVDKARPQAHEILDRDRRHYTYYNHDDVQVAADLGPADILLLHEWPKGLLAGEPAEKRANWLQGTQAPADFGSEQGRLLIDILQPQVVFCGHMHVPFEGVILHPGEKQTRVVCLADVPASNAFVRFFSAQGGVIQDFTGDSSPSQTSSPV